MLSIHTENANTKIPMFGCQSADSVEDSKRVGLVQWWLRRYICSELVTKIQATINNDSSKSIKSIDTDMKVPELLIRQVVHEEIL